MRVPSLRVRFAAFAWDYLCFLVLVAGLVAVSLAVPSFAEQFGDPWRADLWAFALLVAPVMLWLAVQHGLRGATWGKRRVGLRVVREDGSALGFSRALLRAAVFCGPWQCAHTAIFHCGPNGQVPGWVLTALFVLAYGATIGSLVSMLRDPRRRAWHDRIAGSVVACAIDPVS